MDNYWIGTGFWSGLCWLSPICWSNSGELGPGQWHSDTVDGSAQRQRHSLEETGWEAGNDDPNSPLWRQSNSLPPAAASLPGDPSQYASRTGRCSLYFLYNINTARVWISFCLLSLQLGGGPVEGLVEAFQSLGLTEGVMLLRDTERKEDKHSTGEPTF